MGIFMSRHDNMRTRGTLLQRIGDVDNSHAWYEFVYYYRGYICGILRKMGIAHHDSEEIAQQVLLKISDTIKTFKYAPERGRFRGYLARITINTANNHFRSMRHEVSLSENSDGISPDLTEDPAIDKMADEEWENHLCRIAWRNISGSFGKNVKDTWDMLCEGRNPQEIASALNISENSVYVYKKRIMEKIKPEVKRLQIELE